MHELVKMSQDKRPLLEEVVAECERFLENFQNNEIINDVVRDLAYFDCSSLDSILLGITDLDGFCEINKNDPLLQEYKDKIELGYILSDSAIHISNRFYDALMSDTDNNCRLKHLINKASVMSSYSQRYSDVIFLAFNYFLDESENNFRYLKNIDLARSGIAWQRLKGYMQLLENISYYAEKAYEKSIEGNRQFIYQNQSQDYIKSINARKKDNMSKSDEDIFQSLCERYNEISDFYRGKSAEFTKLDNEISMLRDRYVELSKCENNEPYLLSGLRVIAKETRTRFPASRLFRVCKNACYLKGLTDIWKLHSSAVKTIGLYSRDS